MTADETTPDETGRAVLGAEERARFRAVALRARSWWDGHSWCPAPRVVARADVSLAHITVAGPSGGDIAEHIAAFDPPTVLALLDAADERDRLAAEVERLTRVEQNFTAYRSLTQRDDLPTRTEWQVFCESFDEMKAERDAARAEAASRSEALARVTNRDALAALIASTRMSVRGEALMYAGVDGKMPLFDLEDHEPWEIADVIRAALSSVEVADTEGGDGR